MRIMTNLISDAAKYTEDGGILPFVWPVEEMRTLLKKVVNSWIWEMIISAR